MLDELLHRMRGYSPHILQTDKRYPEAAVLVPITRSDEPEVVLTLRASGLSTHGGEVAFPGGRRDPEDADLVETALRESEEEIGLPPGLVEVVGPLSTLVSRHGIKVTPYVGLVPDFVEYKPICRAAGVLSRRPAGNHPPYRLPRAQLVCAELPVWRI